MSLGPPSAETFSGRTAVITGAGSGVGRALALGLSARGAAVYLVGRRPAPLEATAAVARERGARTAVCVPVDLTEDEGIRKLVERVLRDAGGVDILVHSAGTISLGRIEDSSADDLDLQYRTNVRGPLELTRLLLPSLRMRRGQVVFVNSTAGLAARAGVAGYAASKHALKAAADSLREEVNSDGVRVTSVFLGRTASAMQAAVHASEGKVYRPELLVQPEDVAEMSIAALSLPRTAEVTEVHIRPLVKPN